MRNMVVYPCRFVLLSVVKHEERNPKLLQILDVNSILGPSLLQVQVFEAVVIPIKDNDFKE